MENKAKFYRMETYRCDLIKKKVKLSIAHRFVRCQGSHIF
jgi:hypothetical protein